MMHKRMTITLDEAVYDGLNRTIGKRRMSQFIEDLLRPHVLDTSLDDGYKAMGADAARESEANEWCNALAKDMNNEAR
jgi:metal-responsive CopG/Arc/MetJ family transcriptional regulator